MTTHGKTDTREYGIWVQMRRRCRDPRASGYANYGGRGIKVCDRWEDSFENFLADMGACPKDFSIERENGDGDYEPSNCRWASHVEQNNNRRNNVKLTHKGKTMSVRQWAREIGVGYQTLHSRIRRGLSTDEILTPAVRRQNVRLKHDGECLTIREWSNKTGIGYSCLFNRITQLHMPLAEALDPTPIKKRKTTHV